MHGTQTTTPAMNVLTMPAVVPAYKRLLSGTHYLVDAGDGELYSYKDAETVEDHHYCDGWSSYIVGIYVCTNGVLTACDMDGWANEIEAGCAASRRHNNSLRGAL